MRPADPPRVYVCAGSYAWLREHLHTSGRWQHRRWAWRGRRLVFAEAVAKEFGAPGLPACVRQAGANCPEQILARASRAELLAGKFQFGIG